MWYFLSTKGKKLASQVILCYRIILTKWQLTQLAQTGFPSSFFCRFIAFVIEPSLEAFEPIHPFAACSYERFVVVLFPQYFLGCPKSILKKQTWKFLWYTLSFLRPFLVGNALIFNFTDCYSEFWHSVGCNWRWLSAYISACFVITFGPRKLWNIFIACELLYPYFHPLILWFSSQIGVLALALSFVTDITLASVSLCVSHQVI